MGRRKQTFPRPSLAHLDLSGLTLTSEKCNFNGFDFSNSILDYADLSSAKFDKAIFNRARLRNSKFHFTDFNNARMVECDLSDAVSYKSKFTKCNIFTGNLSKAAFFGNSFRETIFFRSSWESTKLIGCDFKNTNFRECKNLTWEQLKGNYYFQDIEELPAYLLKNPPDWLNEHTISTKDNNTAATR